MVSSINLQINNACNNRCKPCNIWKSKIKKNLSLDDLKNLCNIVNKHDVQDISFTGGEPFLHPHLKELTGIIAKDFSNLKMFFINTNGMFPLLTKNFLDYASKKFSQLNLCVSLEGPKDVHNLIRGVPSSFDLVMKTLTNVADFKKISSNVEIILSTTLSKDNMDISYLNYVRCVAKKFGFKHTFRFAETNSSYYMNELNLSIDASFLKDLKEYVCKHHQDDSFLKVMLEHYSEGVNKVMFENGNLKCKAGTNFIYIDCFGNFFPCIHSSRRIGSLKSKSFIKKIKNLGVMERCPCCTECTIYPMLN